LEKRFSLAESATQKKTTRRAEFLLSHFPVLPACINARLIFLSLPLTAKMQSSEVKTRTGKNLAIVVWSCSKPNSKRPTLHFKQQT